MRLNSRLGGVTYSFDSVKEVLGRANELKSGDAMAGIAARSDSERIAAKDVLSDLLISDIRNNPVVPYEEDEVTRLIQDAVDEEVYGRIKNWTIADLREYILSEKTSQAEIDELRKGLTSETIAAVAKLMSTLDLIYGAKKICVETTCNTTMGRRGTLSSRLQPNHTLDGLEGIRASLYEGLSYGCGDAVIGLNPVNDTIANTKQILELFDEVKNKFEIPSQVCVLSHINTQVGAVKQGAPADMIFQSIAGSEKGNTAFGFNADTVREAQQLMRDYGTAKGENVLYFETGQGSELSSDANFGADQVTMEARCYGFAKPFKPFMVNTVVGFIGPEYLYNSKQVMRAGLEDHFMGKLTGIPMGCDCCYTNHMDADQNDIESLAVMLAAAGCTYIISVPSGDDIMLNYQTNSYQDVMAVRSVLGLHPIKEFEDWMKEMEIVDENGRPTSRMGDATIFSESRR